MVEQYYKKFVERYGKMRGPQRGTVVSLPDVFYPPRISDGALARQTSAHQREWAQDIAPIYGVFSGDDMEHEFTAKSLLAEGHDIDILPENRLTTCEEIAELKEKLILPTKSRVLLFSNGGAGKSTLLRAIGLHLCETNSYLQDQYGLDRLQADKIPVYIPLHEYRNQISADDESTLRKCIQREIGKVLEQQNISEEYAKYLLLIDGMDELSPEEANTFVMALSSYLRDYVDTPVVLSTRISAIADDRVRKGLEALDFAGRTIVPFTRWQAKECAHRYIQACAGAGAMMYRDALDTVFDEDGPYGYVSEFLSNPLELFIITSQILNSKSSIPFTRYGLLKELLWQLLTNRIPSRDASGFFADMMEVLSYLALHYGLQFSQQDVRATDWSWLALQSNYISCSSEDVLTALEDLTAHSGVLEKNLSLDGEVGFSFSLRTYQEFLTAYGVYAMENWLQALNLLLEHCNDEAWYRIISFTLSMLKEECLDNEMEMLVNCLIEESSISGLTEWVSGEIRLDSEQTTEICEKYFVTPYLDREAWELLQACLTSKSGDVFCRVLKRLVQRDNNDDYLDAAANAILFENAEYSWQLYEDVYSLLRAGQPMAALGAEIICTWVRRVRGEENVIHAYVPKDEWKRIPFNLSFGIWPRESCRRLNDNTIIECLYDNAVRYSDWRSAAALVFLWLEPTEIWGEDLRVRLDKETALLVKLDERITRVLIQAVEARGARMKRARCSDFNAISKSDLIEILQILSSIGRIPLLEKMKSTNFCDAAAFIYSLFQNVDPCIQSYWYSEPALRRAALYFDGKLSDSSVPLKP